MNSARTAEQILADAIMANRHKTVIGITKFGWPNYWQDRFTSEATASGYTFEEQIAWMELVHKQLSANLDRENIYNDG